MVVLSRIIPFTIVLILLFSSATFLYENSGNPELHRDAASFIPENATAVAFVNSEAANVFLFHSRKDSGIIFSMKQISDAYLIPPIVKTGESADINQVSCFQNFPVYRVDITGNQSAGISGLPVIILSNFGISPDNFTFASPDPGVFIAGNITSVETSLISSSVREENSLLNDINYSAGFSFAYYINSSLARTVSGNYTDNILTATILTRSIQSAVAISLALQYILGKGFIALPTFDSVIILVPGNNSFIFLQYMLIKSILSMDGVSV
ncbi:MAG: hypothetical protein M1375_01390 [Candidatus Thermoplasmatota archaeon]|nr:hypothetical protein [Candidatus Thermoplasmatota archaeon]MCL5790611.1 hypothetical protein [Candidatus Thermoplasmatota archaeon]